MVGVAVAVVALILVSAYAAIVLTKNTKATTTATTQPSTTALSGTTSITQSSTATTVSSSSSQQSNSINVVNLGYYANINHAPAILGISSGTFQNALGPTTKIDTFLFTSGGPEMTALLAGKLDMAYVGPDPAVNAYIQSNGTGLVILAGVSSGGAVFVVQGNSGITSVKDLGGKTFAAPGLGNTQDIALRYYLMENGYSTTTNGGNVTIIDTTNANIVTLFAKGQIDGAWVPQPYGEVLIQQFGGRLFLDERNLWPNGAFSTTELVVRTQFLQQHPDVVRDIVAADVNETLWINNRLTETQTATTVELDLNQSLIALTQNGYSMSILSASLSTMSFTFDPLESSVIQQAQHAYALGDLTQNPASLTGLFDLSILNSVLAADGLPPVTS